ncbi:MAG: hypothetical protein AAFV25_12030, partial [Bacteroidota bacterium]
MGSFGFRHLQDNSKARERQKILVQETTPQDGTVFGMSFGGERKSKSLLCDQEKLTKFIADKISQLNKAILA